MKDVLKRALEEIAPELDLDDLEPDENFREALDLDSFDFLQLMEAIERELEISVPESDYTQFATLESGLAYLARRAG